MIINNQEQFTIDIGPVEASLKGATVLSCTLHHYYLQQFNQYFSRLKIPALQICCFSRGSNSDSLCFEFELSIKTKVYNKSLWNYVIFIFSRFFPPIRKHILKTYRKKTISQNEGKIFTRTLIMKSHILLLLYSSGFDMMEGISTKNNQWQRFPPKPKDAKLNNYGRRLSSDPNNMMLILWLAI